MAELKFSNAAVSDLAEIDGYSVASHGEASAEAYLRSFDDAFARLQNYPHIGVGTPEYGQAYRCLVHRRHRIFYTVDSNAVFIVRIIHHARDPLALLMQRAP